MKQTMKKLLAFLTCGSLACTSLPASAAWESKNGAWSFTENGIQAIGWKRIEKDWYYFREDGEMASGWVKDQKGTWYYLAESGAMKSGWLKDARGDYYYLGENGQMQTGWLQSKEHIWYYLSPTGKMKTGWLRQNGIWYYLSPSGAMAKGFAIIQGGTYFFSDSGAMQSGTVEIDGEIFYFGTPEDGAMKTGQVSINGVHYFFGSDGKAQGRQKPAPSASFQTVKPGGANHADDKKPSGGDKGSSGGIPPLKPDDPTPSVPDEKEPESTPAEIRFSNSGFTQWEEFGVSLNGQTLAYQPNSLSPLPETICKDGKARAALLFPSPKGADGVIIRGGGEPISLSLTTSEQGGKFASSPEGVSASFPFAEATGGTLPDFQEQLEFLWKKDGKLIQKSHCTLKLASDLSSVTPTKQQTDFPDQASWTSLYDAQFDQESATLYIPNKFLGTIEGEIRDGVLWGAIRFPKPPFAVEGEVSINGQAVRSFSLETDAEYSEGAVRNGEYLHLFPALQMESEFEWVGVAGEWEVKLVWKKEDGGVAAITAATASVSPTR